MKTDVPNRMNVLFILASIAVFFGGSAWALQQKMDSTPFQRNFAHHERKGERVLSSVHGERSIAKRSEVESTVMRGHVSSDGSASAVMTISKSGVYPITNDFVGRIRITASDTVLDLNGFKICGSSDPLILVDPGVSNVTIKNGTVQGDGASSDQTGIELGAGSSRINISHVEVVDCMGAGIDAVGTSGSMVSDVIIEHCQARSSGIGIQFTQVNKASVVGCEMVSSTTGMQLNSSFKVCVQNSRALCNAQAGFSLISSSTNTFLECKAIDSGDGGNAFGFVSENGMCNLFDACIAESTHTSGVDPFFAAGFMLSGLEQKSKIVHSQANNATGTNAYGMWLKQSAAFGANELLLAELDTQAHGGNVFSVDWLVCGDSKYVGMGGANGTSNADIRVFKFNTTTEMLEVLTSATFDTGGLVTEVQWLVSGDSKYLTAVGVASPEVNIFKFDIATGMLSLVETLLLGSPDARSIDWLLCDNINYLAVGESSLDDGEISVYAFDIATETLNTVVPGTTFDDQTAATLEWQVLNDTKYLAIGYESAGVSVRIVEFDATASTLTALSSATFDHGASVNSVDWLGDTNLLAVGGNDGDDSINVRVLEFDCTNLILSQLGSATVDTASTTNEVAWQECLGKIYLGVGTTGSGSEPYVLVLLFEDNLLKSTSAQLNGLIAGRSLDWLRCGESTYIASAKSNDVAVNSFNGCVALDPSCNIIKKNHFTNNAGIGVQDDTALTGTSTNEIYANFSCKNGTNFNIGTQFPISAAKSKGVGETENIDCSLEGTDDFEEIKFTICDKAQSICSKLDAIDMEGDEVKFTIVDSVDNATQSLGFTICEKIEQAMLCSPTAVTASTTIATSGHYCLANNATGDFLITASNVRFDLNGYTIEGGTNGIEITGNEVTVHNGTVRGATESGIKVTGDKNRLENLDLVASTTGVELASANANTIENCRALCNTSAGFSLLCSNRNCIINCKAVDNGGTGNVFGFVSDTGMCNLFDGCIAENTHTTVCDPFFAAGFMLTGTETQSKIVHSQASNTVGDGSYGMWLRSSIGVSIPLSQLSLTELDTQAHGGSINSVDWLVCGNDKYVAMGGASGTGGIEVRVFKFNAATQMLEVLTNAVFNAAGTVEAVQWLVCGDSKYLAIGGFDTSAEVRILKFNVDAQTLSSVASVNASIAVRSLDWLVCGDSKYLATGGSVGRVAVFAFDATTESLSTVVSEVDGANARNVNSVKWKKLKGSKYLALGSDDNTSGADTAEVRILEFDADASTLTALPTATFDHGEIVTSIDWLEDTALLAIGGGDSSDDGAYVRVLEFDCVNATLSQLGSATFAFDPLATERVESIAWHTCGAIRYLGVSLSENNPYAQVLSFEDNLLKSTSAALTGGSSPVRSVDWLRCGNTSYMALAKSTAVTVNSFNDSCLFPSCNIIKENHITNNAGTGIQDDAGNDSTNQIYSNFSCKNGTNFAIGTQFPISAAQSKGVGETENIDCSLAGTDDFEEIKFTVCDKVENAQASLGFTICDKIELATLCSPTAVTASTTIATSGHYCLANDITGDVLISGNNVSLDLNGYTVSGGTNGITVSGDENTVHGGAVRGATASGISVTGDKNRLENLDLIASATGVELSGANANTIENCRALCNTSAGFSLLCSNHNCIINCKAVDNGGSGNAFGFVSDTGMCNLFDGCIAENTNTSGVDPFFAAGFLLTGTELQSKIVHSQASNGSGFGIRLKGIFVPEGDITLDALMSATFDHNSNKGVRSVAWLVCGDSKYLAIGGDNSNTDGAEVRVLKFDADTQILSQVGSATFDHGSLPGSPPSLQSVAWQVCGDSKYLAIGGRSSLIDSAEVRVLKFDDVNETLSQVGSASFDHGSGSDDRGIRSVAWLVCGDSKYLAIGGENGTPDDMIASNDIYVRVLEFDEDNATLSQVGSATFNHGDNVFSVVWQVCGDSKYLAIAGEVQDNIAVRVLKFDDVNATLSQVGSATFDHGNRVHEVDWQVCGDSKYLAIGGFDGADNAEVRVLKFDDVAQTLFQVGNAAFAHNGTIFTVAWQMCGANKYLAIGGENGGANNDVEVQVLEFDPDAQTLSQAGSAAFDHGDSIYSVAWQACGDTTYLAISGFEGDGGEEVRVLAFNGCSVGPRCSIIKENHVVNNVGVGLQDDSLNNSLNHIYSNFSCKNGTNFSIGTQFPISAAQSKSVGETENIDCSLSAVDPFACNPTAITASTTIATSGHYCLANAVSGDMLITASNVTLDLNGYAVSGGTNGIRITGDEVTVHNGTVRGAGVGVRVEGDKNRLEGLDLVSNSTGVELSSADANVIENCRALCNSSFGFLLGSSNRNCVINCKAVDNGDGGNAAGFISESGMCNLFEGCVAENTSTTGASPFFAAGFVLSGLEQQSKIKHCQASNTEGADVVGIWLKVDTIFSENLEEIAQFNHGDNDTIQSVAWHTCNGRNFLAIGGAEGDAAPAGNEVRVLEFDCSANTLTEVATFSHGTNSVIRSVAWYSCEGRSFLAIGGDESDVDDNEVRVLEFDCANSTLTDIAQFNHGPADKIDSVAWHTCDGRSFLAISGFPGNDPATSEVRVLEFDCTASTLTDIAQFDHGSGSSIFSVAWYACDDREFLAIGGVQSNVDLNELRVLEFDCTNSTLTEIAEFNNGNPGAVISVAWHRCSGRDFLAMGNSQSSLDGNEVRVFEFDCTSSTLTEIAQFNHGSNDIIQSVAWLSCNSKEFLAIGGNRGDDDNEVRVLEFDCTNSTLTDIVSFNHGNDLNESVESVAWYTCNGKTLLAIGGTQADDGNEVRVLEFSECPLLQCNIIKKNHVSNNAGTGIQDDAGNASTNHIYSNFSCKNTTNYNIGTQFPISPAKSKGVGETENIDCALDGTDAFEEIKFTICDKIGQGPLCDPTSISQTNMDAAGGDLTLVAELASSLQNYCFAQDITGDITITSSNVHLDLNHRELTGAISISGEGVTVENGVVNTPAGSSASAAITISGSRAHIAEVEVISDEDTTTGRHGILVSGSQALIDNNVISAGSTTSSGDGGHGIIVNPSANKTFIENNVIKKAGDSAASGAGGDGIRLSSGTTNNVVRNNTIACTGDGSTDDGMAIRDMTAAAPLGTSKVYSNFAFDIANTFTVYSVENEGAFATDNGVNIITGLPGPFSNVFTPNKVVS